MKKRFKKLIGKKVLLLQDVIVMNQSLSVIRKGSVAVIVDFEEEGFCLRYDDFEDSYYSVPLVCGVSENSFLYISDETADQIIKATLSAKILSGKNSAFYVVEKKNDDYTFRLIEDYKHDEEKKIFTYDRTPGSTHFALYFNGFKFD